MNDVTQAVELLAPETLGVFPDSDSAVTKPCEECGKPFTPTTPRQRFCGNACRQAAHRKSPAHRNYLDKQKERRLLRRNNWTRLRHRDMAINNRLGVLSGPMPSSILPLGAYDLPKI
jgi:hypothetical protein